MGGYRGVRSITIFYFLNKDTDVSRFLEGDCGNYLNGCEGIYKQVEKPEGRIHLPPEKNEEKKTDHNKELGREGKQLKHFIFLNWLASHMKHWDTTTQ